MTIQTKSNQEIPIFSEDGKEIIAFEEDNSISASDVFPYDWDEEIKGWNKEKQLSGVKGK